MNSEEINECIKQSINEFKGNFTKTNYDQTLKMSETIFNLTKALSCQLKNEKIISQVDIERR